MDRNSFYLKKFSIGLTLLDSVEAYDRFLQEYGKYINNIYFSLPMGDRFHSRVVFKDLLKDKQYVELFWNLLLCAQKYSINLELLFNTPGLNEIDIRNSFVSLEEHGVKVQKIGILDEYYGSTRKYFPTQKLVYSFNNFPNTLAHYASIKNSYDEIVVARQFIRDNQLFSFIKETLNSNVVLLVNNGCSQVCGGCKTCWHCHDSYYREHSKYSAEYQYALQSVFPFEINEGCIDTKNVDLLKIASRNDNLSYVKKVIDSYVNDNSICYVQSNKHNYLLWSRLQWHTDYFNTFDYNRLVSLKKGLYDGNIKEVDIAAKTNLRPGLDLRDYFTLSNIELNDDKFSEYVHSMKRHINVDYLDVDTIIFGCETCEKLLQVVDISVLIKNIRYAKNKGLIVALELPPINRVDVKVFLERIMRIVGEDLYYLVINDEETLKHVNVTYRTVKLILGRAFDRIVMQKNLSKNVCASTDEDKLNLFGSGIRLLCDMFDIEDIMVDIPHSGLFISNVERLNVWSSISGRIVDRSPFCLLHITGEGSCDFGCLIPSNKEPFTNIDIGNRRLGRVTYENINMNVPGIYSTLIEQRIKYLYMPWDDEYLKGWSQP